MNVKTAGICAMEHVRTHLDRITAFVQLAMYLVQKKLCVLVRSINFFITFKIIFLQILMNVIWEYMTVVGMLFVLTLLEGSIVLAKIISLGMEDPA
jgi:hypothetical protein